MVATMLSTSSGCPVSSTSPPGIRVCRPAHRASPPPALTCVDCQRQIKIGPLPPGAVRVARGTNPPGGINEGEGAADGGHLPVLVGVTQRERSGTVPTHGEPSDRAQRGRPPLGSLDQPDRGTSDEGLHGEPAAAVV